VLAHPRFWDVEELSDLARVEKAVRVHVAHVVAPTSTSTRAVDSA
jgi:hypothetical protein